MFRKLWQKFYNSMLKFRDNIETIGLPSGTVVKNPPVNAGDPRDVSSISDSRRYPRERNGNPLQCSCLENSMDRAAWRATVCGVLKSWTGGGNGNPLQYSCLENPIDRGAWQLTVYGVTSRT